ncbi:TIGR04013 family B12-binding domain/radical SAM domain-containing protein [Methanococcus aeolicus]|uniref:TIGR04013 family B12-binding domain/radical SAM domain-containing protein n=1 Tax=Methanococcus aeolicus TaxID=42879 RepID=UPI0021C7F7ED|nr:TIGR04013 family B12-binding domain/radical SAM domain-containing protein [Methanococcus aeolicus]UXM84283.1 TIGR04013 family B12-binding domain/radical SAM domain-containing protein [Methanococcus aeolicus]
MIGFKLTPKNRYSVSKLYPIIGGKLFKNFNEIMEHIKNGKLNILIYSFTSLQRDKIAKEIEIINKIKKEKKSTHPILIAGGPHPSGAPNDTLKIGFDFVIVGEGEITLPKIISKLNQNKELNNKIIMGEPINDLDEFDKINPMTPVEITRGCPYKCGFCQTPQIFGNKVRHRSIDNILKSINPNSDVRLITPNAFCYGSETGTKPNIEKLELLLKKLREGKGKLFFGTFPSEVRPEFIQKDTIELVAKYCHNKYLHFGAQSGSDEMLKLIRRGHTVNDVLNGVDLCKDYNLIPKVDFIFGFPNENEFHRKESMELLNYIIKKGGKVHAHYFMPLVGTNFEGSSPTPLDKKTLKTLGQLSQKGLVSGSWSYQRDVQNIQ